MLAEGIIIREHASLQKIKKKAITTLKAGPVPWSTETIRLKRYFITDLVDDLKGSTKRAETIYISNELSYQLHEFLLRTNQRWIGSSKWIDRVLRDYDNEIANLFISALDDVYLNEDVSSIVKLTERILEPHGGFLFSGFSLGKAVLKNSVNF